MNEHDWVGEHVATYLARGLDAQEAERIESHVRECPACADVLAAARALDSGMAALFAGVRPGPGFEDRAIARLRTDGAAPRTPGFARTATRVAAVAAAILVLGAVGSLAASVVNGEGLPMPGGAKSKREVAQAVGSPPAGGDTGGAAHDLTNEDPGLNTNLHAALPELERFDKQTVDRAVTNGTLGQPNAPDSDTTALAVPGLQTHDFSVHNNSAWVENTNGRAPNFNYFGSALAFSPDGKQFAPFPGGSSATKTTLLRDGGGDSPPKLWDAATGGTVTTTNGPMRGVRFSPNEYMVPVQKTVTRTELPVPKQVVVVTLPAKIPQADGPKEPAPQPPIPNAEPARRVILRNGDIEFEVPAFDAASAAVAKLVNGTKGAFIATINSEKLSNGKVKGSITVRVPPEHLDALVDGLKKEIGATGELKGAKLASQDVTKQYYDLESRLRAARTVEQRLLQIIKEGKGEIKLLLEAEKELGVWRTKIEEFEGELRYFANLAALSTLNVVITEKEIRAAAGLLKKERVQAGVEVENVESAYLEFQKAVVDTKGRISKAELKQLSAGQFNASVQFEVAPGASGPMRDRLRQLGRVARLEIDTVTEAEGGTLPTDAKERQGDTVFLVQLYNLANVAPREAATLQVAVVDVAAAYQALRDAVAKASGRVLNAQLNEQDRTNVTGQLDFEVKRAEEPGIRAAIDATGEVVSRQVGRAPEGDNVTDGKVLYRVSLGQGSRLPPREKTVVGVEVADVDQTAAAFGMYATNAKGRQVDSTFSREASGKVTAKLIVEVPLAAAPGLVEQFKNAGTVRVYQSVRDAMVGESKFATARIEVTLTNRAGIVADDDGVWQQVRRGLSYSASTLLTSVTWVVFGLCVVLPWAIIALVVYRLVRRRPRPSPATTNPPAVG